MTTFTPAGPETLATRLQREAAKNVAPANQAAFYAAIAASLAAAGSPPYPLSTLYTAIGAALLAQGS